jgi:hypothetical protein
MSQLEVFRAEKDRFFKEHPQSPLTDEQRASFAGLSYFPENPALRLALPVEPPGDPSPLVMQTSTGETQSYQRYGRIRFAVAGSSCPSPMPWPAARRMAPGATLSPTCWTTGACSSTSTWPTIPPAPTTMSGPAR